MRKLIAVTVGTVAVLLAGACGADDPDGDGAEIVDEVAGDATTPADDGADADAGSAAGTRDNPLPPGTAFEVGYYQVELASTDTDAEQEIAEADEFAVPPVDGRQYVMVELSVTYTGPDSGDPFIDLGISFYGSSGNTYGDGEDDYCGLLPNDLVDVGEMFTDASAAGTYCVSVPADEIDGGAWIVEDFLALSDTDRTFVALD